jgi:hypothetical protein
MALEESERWVRAPAAAEHLGLSGKTLRRLWERYGWPMRKMSERVVCVREADVRRLADGAAAREGEGR